MSKFLDLVKESVITQAAITLILVSTASYMAATGKEIPDLIELATMLVLGFYFGSKSQQIIQRTRRQP